MRISDWGSDVCSSDLPEHRAAEASVTSDPFEAVVRDVQIACDRHGRVDRRGAAEAPQGPAGAPEDPFHAQVGHGHDVGALRSEEHTSELQSLMRISYAVFCLKKKSTVTTIEKNN